MRIMALFATFLLTTVAFPMMASADVCLTVDILEFDGEKANESVTTQVEFGPRIPGSNASMELRNWFLETRPEFDWRLDPHHRGGYNLTNLEGKLTPLDSTEETPVIVLAAHYDSRHRAERDPNPNMTEQPIPGANDGGSGVAVLWELARIIPSLNLDHEVWILLTDAEDQGLNGDISTWALGARAWAENQTQDDINRTDAFLLVDMIGDADLKIYRTFPPSLNNEEGNRLWMAVENLSGPLGLLDGVEDCSGSIGQDIINFSSMDGVNDDHVPMNEVGIPAIDFIDIRYGENATAWQGYWHTHEDTPDKVSAESLAHIGRLLELGLREGSWLRADVLEPTTEVPETTEVTTTFSPIVSGVVVTVVVMISLVFLGLHQSVRLKR